MSYADTPAEFWALAIIVLMGIGGVALLAWLFTNNNDPWSWVNAHTWQMAGQPGFGDAYGSALLNEVENPGSDPAVITDNMILAAVQSIMIVESEDG